MTETDSLESKIVRIQAAVDELSDTLASELRRVVVLIGSGDTLGAIQQLQVMIEGAETFTNEPEEKDE